MNYKRHSLILIFIPVFLILPLIGVVIYVDVYQTRQYPFYDKTKYEKSSAPMIIQARGIIKNVDFDGLIVGTSILENTSALEASELLGGRFVNLSLGGMNLSERYWVIKYALEQRKLKQVIISLDYYEFPHDTVGTRSRNQIFKVLYDQNPFNDYTVYDQKAIFESFKLLKAPKKEVDYKYFDRPTAWYTSTEKYLGGIQNWFLRLKDPQISNFITEHLPELAKRDDISINDLVLDVNALEETKLVLDKLILDLAKKYKNVKFYIIIPPYSSLFFKWCIRYAPKSYPVMAAYLKYFLEISSLYPNIELYGFNDMDYTDDIGNYIDAAHYGEEMNSYMTHSLATKNHLLTISNLDIYLEEVSRKVDLYNVKALNNEVQELLMTDRLSNQ